jgi:hypothetical protein
MEFGYELFELFEIELGGLAWILLNREAHVFFHRAVGRSDFDFEIRRSLVTNGWATSGASRDGPVQGQIQLRWWSAVDCSSSVTTTGISEGVDGIWRRHGSRGY